MLLMVEKYITGRICHSMYDTCRKNQDINLELLHTQYWDAKNLYGWAMSQRLPVNNFEWIKDTSQFNKSFLKKTIMKKNDEGYFLEFDCQYLEKSYELLNDYHFYQKE